MKCKHQWEKISETTMPAPFEIITLEGIEGSTKIPNWGFRRKYVLVLQCKLCGKLDKTIEVNP